MIASFRDTRWVRRLADRLPRPIDAAVWVAPLVIYLGVRHATQPQLLLVIVGLLGAGVLFLASGQPGPSAAVLGAGIPVAQLVLPLLLRLGLPASMVAQLRFWKELVLAGLVLAALRHRRRTVDPRPFDRIDILAIAFCAVVVIYAFVPPWLPDDVIVPGDARDLATRNALLPVLAFLAIRHAGIPDRWRPRIMGAIVVGGVLIAVGCILEIRFPSTWSRVTNNWLQLSRYNRLVLNDRFGRNLSFSGTSATSERVQRASSLMSSPLDAAFTILGPLAVAVHILQRRWSMGALLAAGVLAAGLQETQTRGAFVGAMVMVLVAVLGQRGLLSSQKVRFAAVVFGASVFLVPVVVQSSLGERLGAAISGEDEESADGHWDRVQAAWDAVVAQPLGRGIGSSGAVGERYRVVGHIFPENYFLYAALEEGVVGSLLFIGLLGSAALAIRRRPARDAVDTSAVGVIVAFGVTGLVLDSFATLSAVPVFVLIGLSLAPREANGPSPA